MSDYLDDAKNTLDNLNHDFQSKRLADEKFYQRLEAKGFDIKESLIISHYPDGCDTFVGIIIRQDGAVFDYDIDLDSDEYSDLIDITNEFRRKFVKNTPKKSELINRVAWEISENRRERG